MKLCVLRVVLITAPTGAAYIFYVLVFHFVLGAITARDCFTRIPVRNDRLGHSPRFWIPDNHTWGVIFGMTARFFSHAPMRPLAHAPLLHVTVSPRLRVSASLSLFQHPLQVFQQELPVGENSAHKSRDITLCEGIKQPLKTSATDSVAHLVCGS